MSKTRYDLDISYTDKGGTRRYLNRVGVLFMEGDRGSIVLTPGVSIHSAEGTFINVNLPRAQREGGQGSRGGQHGGSRGQRDAPDPDPFNGADSDLGDIPF